MSEAGSQNQPDEATVDLLIKQVIEGLSPAEQRALDVLDSAIASEYLEDFARAAAAISLAGMPSTEPPAALLALLEQQAASHFAAERPAPPPLAPATTANVVSLRDRTRGVAPSIEVRAPAPRRTVRGGAMGWFAAAACLLLAVFGWLRSPQLGAPPVADVHLQVPPAILPPTPVPPAPPTPAEERSALLAREGTLKVALGATKDPASKGVTGDVVWDPARQKGFLHFTGLAANDPRVSQYQVWIFDGQRDKKYPVDGGVFDIPAGGADVIIPIRASLNIGTAKAFAVTIEKPGGVVVSGLAHVVVLGAAG